LENLHKMSISTAEPDSNKRLLSKLDTVAVKSLFLSLTLAISLYPARAGIILADFEPEMPKNTASSLDSVLVGGPVIHKTAPAHTVRKVTVTAYTSSPEETDDTPFITASGTTTRDGVLASNFLPFGTKVRIPDAFGDKVFVVEDRMHPRMKNVVDVWMPTKKDAYRFGTRTMEIHILN